MTTADDQWTLAHLDQWAGLGHKAAMGQTPKLSLAPSWVPPDERRRLAAYTILAAYMSNASRVLLDPATADDKAARREYGDPALLVRRVVGAILGDSTSIVVDGAETKPDLAPTLPDPPAEPDGDADEITRRVYATQTALWADAANEAVDAWEAAWAAYPGAAAQQAALRDWAGDEQLDAKILEWNGNAAGLGDGVIELAISTKRGRPVATVHDPGFYFPILEDLNDDYPSVVHLAWEYEDTNGVRWVRRRTYRLVDDGVPRRYPWGDEVSTSTCLMSDGRWRLDATGVGIADLDPAKATWAMTEDGIEARDLDLGLDFIPVVHLPNTPSDQSHYGEAVLTLLAQLLDDIQEADSNLREAAGLAAVPLIAFSGEGSIKQDLRVEAGATIRLGPNGRLDVLDMAAALPALRDRIDDLLDRLSVNSRVSAEVMGRVDSSDAASGIAMLLAFGPFIQLIGELRLTRNFKHGLLLKFAGRMLQLTGQIEPGDLAPARLALGSFLPSDLADVVARVVALLEAHAISRQTAVAMLVAAGMTIDDAAGEVDRIRHEDTAGAKDAGEATTSNLVGAYYLGIDLDQIDPKPGPPTVELPGPSEA